MTSIKKKKKYLVLIFSDNTANEDGKERASSRAATAECLACSSGIGVAEYCRHNPTVTGCQGTT